MTLEGMTVLEAKALRKLCKLSFWDFIQIFWPAVVPDAPVWSEHMRFIADELQRIGERVRDRLPAEYDYVIINVPPGSSKSTIASIMYPIWCWTIDPVQRFICASYAADIAEDHANKATRLLDSELFQQLFPEVVMKRMALSHMENTLGGERYTAATGSAVTGKHAHQIIVDDPLNPKQAASEVELKNATNYISQTLSTRKVDKAVTPTILIMQRLHENDPTGHLLAKQAEGLRVRHICLPAEQSARVSPAEAARLYTDGYLDKVRLSPDILRKMRLDLGSYGYAGQFDQNPAPPEGGIIRRQWFEIVDRPVPPYAVMLFRLDTAYTDKQANDPTGLLAYYMGTDGVLYITHFEAKRLEFPDLVAYIPEYVKRQGYTQRSMIKVEPKASGLSVVQTLKSIPALNIMASKPPKDDKATRAQSISPKVESGKVKLHRGPWNEAFLHEVCTFPNASHDEAMDLLVEAVTEHLITDATDYGYKRR